MPSTSLFYWICKRFERVHVHILDAVQNCSVISSVFTNPLCQCFRHSVDFNPEITAIVVGLLKTGSPSHVSGLVVPVIVDTINRVRSGWGGTNALKKLLESAAPFPLFVHCNSSAAISLIRRVPWVTASLSHPYPRFMLRRERQAVSCIPLREHFRVQASARLAKSLFKVYSGNNSVITAGAFAMPHHALSSLWCEPNNRKPSVSFTSKVNKRLAGWVRLENYPFRLCLN